MGKAKHSILCGVNTNLDEKLYIFASLGTLKYICIYSRTYLYQAILNSTWYLRNKDQ